MTAHALLQRLTAQLGGVLQGQAPAIRLVAAAFASGGHVLLEDYPGTGKTTLAKALAISLGLHFQRVQFTPDLLPMDILGVNIYEPAQQGFRLHRGPIFTQILLADEINRASPRTQAALIEAMAERQVSLDGTCHPLDPLFFVIATQNPVEFHGTYPLPEAQLDRFALCFRLGYVTPAEECAILQAQRHRHPLDDLAPCLSAAESASLPAAAAAVAIGPELLRYIVALVGIHQRPPEIESRLVPGPRDGPAAGGEEARGVQLIRMDIIDIRPGEDGDGNIAQVDGFLAGLRLMGDGFRCALPILRAALFRPTKEYWVRGVPYYFNYAG